MEKKTSTASRVERLVEPLATAAGVSIWDVRFEKEGASWFLRVVIDAPEGVTFDHCEAVSRPLSAALDEDDFIEQSYFLEVSSPGLSRRLTKPAHFEACRGRAVVVTRIRPDDTTGERVFFGTLTDFTDGVVNLQTQAGAQAIPYRACAHVKLDDENAPA